MHILIGCTERIVAEKRVLDAVARSMDQEMVILNQLMLKSSGVEILRGPLVLAKADVVGTPEPELISQKSIYGSDPKLRLEPISAPTGVWGGVESDHRGRESALHSCLRFYFSWRRTQKSGVVFQVVVLNKR